MLSLMQAGGATTQAVQGVSHAASSPLLVKWLCLCLGRLVEDQPELLSQVWPSNVSLPLENVRQSHKPLCTSCDTLKGPVAGKILNELEYAHQWAQSHPSEGKKSL